MFAAAGAIVGGFQKVDDAKYQVIRELNETSKRLVGNNKAHTNSSTKGVDV